VEVLKGIGPQLTKPLKRLGLERVVDILFHLPVNWIDRKRVELLDEADAGLIVSVLLTPVDYRQSGGRGPFRVHATDHAGNYVTLTYFNNPGWAKKQLPLGEAKLVSGRLDRYGQELQIVHPDYVLPPAKPRRSSVSRSIAVRRPHQQPHGPACRPGAGRVRPREWIEPSLRSRGLARLERLAHAHPAAARCARSGCL
jgi:ATP-dependent DNA helicase RecG